MKSDKPERRQPRWRIGPGGATDGAPKSQSEPTTQQTPASGAFLRRRQLLRRSFWGGTGVMAAGALAILGDFLNAHPPPPRFGEMINVPAVKLPNPGGAPYRDAAGRFWLVNLKPGEGAPGAAHGFGRPSDAGGLLALYERCPFRGCRVIWRPDFIFLDYTSWFRCPCCGSTFTKAGLRVIGPAPRSLDTFPVARLPLGGISVNTGRILLGGRDDPQRAQPAS